MNKYKAKKYNCKQGHIHDSRDEGNYCNELALLKKAGEILDYNIQIKFDLVVNGFLICKHIVDFVVITKENKKEVHEYKGYATRGWRIKQKLFIALYPEIKYIVVRNLKRKYTSRINKRK